MKKILLTVLIIALLISLCSCATTTTSNTSYADSTDKPPCHGIITWGSNGVYHIEVEDYIRVSDGWIVITATDGKKYSTNEKNVLIIRER